MGLRNKWRSTIITSTKGLQDQYEQDDSDIYSLKGKTNYPCPMGGDYYTGKQCHKLRGEGICEDAKKVCTYVKRRSYWCAVAPLRLTNTSFQVVAAEGLVMEPENKANLVVVDECHDIDEQLVNHSTLLIDVDNMHSIKKTAGKRFADLFPEFINYFMEVKVGVAFKVSPELMKVGKELLEACHTKVEELEEKIKENKKFAEHYVAAVDEISSISEKLSLFVNNSGEWLITDFKFSNKLEIKPVYAYQVSDYALFRKADYFLHMSATICGFDSYAANLGIKKEDYVYMDLPNPIPLKNRIVTIIPKIKVSGDFDRTRLVSMIDKIIDRHGGENGVVHTVSFALANEIKEISRHSKNMVVSNNRDEIVDILKRDKKGYIILSPSIEKGYDFKGDMCRFQILPKTPYGFLGDPWIKLNLERDSQWYSRKAVLRLVQASGRAVRGVNDYASTYILDSNVELLIKRSSKLFPQWYIDSIKFL
jgi:Rad3-related DNA helicase